VPVAVVRSQAGCSGLVGGRQVARVASGRRQGGVQNAAARTADRPHCTRQFGGAGIEDAGLHERVADSSIDQPSRSWGHHVADPVGPIPVVERAAHLLVTGCWASSAPWKRRNAGLSEVVSASATQ
jgi:hypothetical protein